jgi:L-2,4-diaminobutyric acid acetyltransferase
VQHRNDQTAPPMNRIHTPLRAISSKAFTFRTPIAQDARDVNDLVAASPPLDTNSLYCNLLQCTHFADTCLLAEQSGALRGWVSAYRPPNDLDAIFVWQVAVHDSARGRGLGARLLEGVLALPSAAGVTHLKTTITPSNQISRAMFTRFARQRGLALETRPWFDRIVHFGGQHESEELVSIGPLPAASFAP